MKAQDLLDEYFGSREWRDDPRLPPEDVMAEAVKGIIEVHRGDADTLDIVRNPKTGDWDVQILREMDFTRLPDK